MKNKKVLLTIIIVIFTVAAGVLFSIYSGQARELSQLDNELNQARTRYSNLLSDIEDLQGELAQAQSLLDASQAQFPEFVESIEYGDALFEIADDCGVRLTNLTASRPSNKTIGTVTYSTSSFGLKVDGSIDSILDFIYSLRTGDDFWPLPWSTEVTSVKLDVSGGSASISLIIYGYEG
jgi:hypothetical protein